MNNLKLIKPYVLFLFVIVLFIVTALLINTRTIKLSSEPAEALDGCWAYTDYAMCLDLPADLDVDAGEAYTVHKILPSAFDDGQVILVRSSLQNIELALDGEIIYQVDYEDEATYASMWHMIEIPRDASGQSLSLTFSSPYEAMSGTVNDVHYGSDLALHAYIVQSFGFRLAIGLFTLIVGIFMIIGSAVYKPKQSIEYAYVGMFAVVLSFWVISESRMLQYVTGNIFIIGSLSYLSLSVFPIPILRYLKTFVMKKITLPFRLLCYMFAGNTLAIIVLHFTGLADFFETVMITQALIGIGLIIVFIAMMIEYYKYDNKDTKSPLLLLGILFVFGLFEVATFIAGNFDQTSVFLVTGLLIVMILVGVRYIRFLRERFKLGYEKEFYEKLAYIDPLTGANNRLAFEKDLETSFNHPSIRNTLRLLYLDLDNLKRINDDYGHGEGDRILKIGYSIIKQVFSDYGTCYRIGGDEFACIAMELDEATYKEKQALFESLFEAYQEGPYPIRMSIGSKVYEEGLTLDAFIKDADEAMYHNKKKYKGRESE